MPRHGCFFLSSLDVAGGFVARDAQDTGLLQTASRPDALWAHEIFAGVSLYEAGILSGQAGFGFEAHPIQPLVLPGSFSRHSFSPANNSPPERTLSSKRV